MRQLFLVLATLPILAACTSASVTYDVSMDIDDEERRNTLLFSSMRVIERRMANIGEELLDLDLKRNGGSTQIYVEAAEQASLDLLTDELTAPFDLQIMEEAPIEEAETVVDGHGGFRSTGVTGENILWFSASEEEGGKGRVTISFSDEGRQLMATVFEGNLGKYIGLFVRGQLVSKLLVETDEIKDDIIITDIPSATLASVFADDVNVGLHVTFTPVK